MGKQVQALLAAVLFSLSCVSLLRAAEAKRPPEWDKIVEAARKEAKVVIAIPPSNELRKELEIVLKQKFGIEAELIAAPGPKNASRIAAEKRLA